MAILKNPLNGDFTQIPNALITDKNVKDRPCRVMLYLFSKPHNWKINNSDIMRQFEIKSRDTVGLIWKGLINAGWITRHPSERQGGRFSGYDYELNISPCPILPCTVEDGVGADRAPSDRSLNKTDSNNTDNDNNTEFKKPSRERLIDYFVSNAKVSVIGAQRMADRFLAYYKKVEWKVKKNGKMEPMTNWKTAATGWWKRQKNVGKHFKQPSEGEFKSKGANF